MDGGAVNRQIAVGEQAGEDALRHNVGVRNANVAARCAAAGTDERGVAAIFRRRDIDHAAVFDNLLHFGNVALQLARPCMAVLAHHVIFDGHFGIVIVAVVACLGRAMDIGVRVGIAVFFGVA